ncbi:hypothetical protein BXZ70DRAFT_948062 [Cristinia sonorae]|uniref:Needs CLA4 to survive protein 3 n=1 Tax=Cristinia sonorae TaxID=1940300 RepID=A0A8K0ULL8_9AGAR|nr:hypothetical protein BXZ70DRAFT_948062 [Cristinia sonorae]
MSQLRLEDYRRYGRQLILDGIGLPGQVKLQSSSVVVVGAGGLGCPAIQYLAAAGVGTIGIIDHDVVELSNLQRQILHTEETIGVHKAISAALSAQRINPNIKVEPISSALLPENALELLKPYDVILDCTDNVPTRYLLSDTAVALGTPLVSGAAQKFDGQLCVYNLGKDGPCYRCLFPRPPAPELTGSCEEVGILGAVTGVIGNLQALEAIKLITGLNDGKASLLIYSALSSPPFRSIRLRSRKPTCAACGSEGNKVGTISSIDYITFCGGPRPDWEARGLGGGNLDTRISALDLKAVLDSGVKARILDVRSRTEFGICHLPDSINIPLNELTAKPPSEYADESSVVYVVCRLGNDSQLAVDALRGTAVQGIVKDLIGGLRAWAKDVDPSFPVY